MTCLLMVPGTEKVEEEGSDLTDDQGLCTDETTDAVPHNADSKPEALEVGGDRDPAKGRKEASQACDVYFLGDKDMASMVMLPRESIQLKESSAEKERHQRRDASSQKQKSSRPEKGKRGGTHPKDPSAGGGGKRKGSRGSTERTRQDERNPKQSPSETSSPSQCDIGSSSRRKRQRRRKQPESSVLRPGPDISDEGHLRKSGEGEFRRRKLSSRLGHRDPADIHPKEVLTDSGCESKGLGCDMKEPSLGKREDPRRRRSERLSRSRHGKSDSENSGVGMSGPVTQRRTKKRSRRRVGAFQSGPAPSNQQRHQELKRRNSRKRKLSSGLGDGNREDIHPKKALTDSGWRSKKHSSDAREPKLNKQGGPRQRRSRRRRWVFRSGPNASDRDRRLSARNSRKFSSGPGESKRQDTYPREPPIQSRNASNRLGGDTSKSTLDAGTTRQSRSDEKKSCRESPSGRKSGVKPSHSSRASAARREVNRQNAGALLDNSTISTKYPGFHEYVLGSRLKLRREIKSGAKIKSELSDCGFEKTVDSGDQGFSGESGTENRLGVEILDPALAYVSRQVMNTGPSPKKARHSSSQRRSVGLLPS
ncbi:hypothetical protein HPB47_012992 [Ixodes persulcatus]|uniref:Uncharacterized protein n=1 Tax=Ixodes persulcatus TaxID=34615 RepID=A0AC60NS20_IXOPE|nr:hypothetical protein HPB47_012992 [Ixodes persulcatus]